LRRVLAALESYRRSIEAAAQAFVVQVVTIPVTDAAGVRMAIESFAHRAQWRPPSDPGILSPAVQRELIRLAEQYHLPTDHWVPYPCGRWQLMSYDSDVFQNRPWGCLRCGPHHARRECGRIAGAYPTTFRLAVNLRAAKAIGLSIPASSLLLADEVIE
jgi:putative ABC transport system substrate-binding protein